MGTMKNQAHERKDRKLGKRKGASAGSADWMNCKPELLQRAIASLAYTGGAMRLGYTRDGGAYAVGIYGDGEPYTLYVPPGEDIDAWLTDFIAEVADNL